MRGFLLPGFFGYLGGFLCLDKPWGHPSFVSFKSPYIIYAFVSWGFVGVVLYDIWGNVFSAGAYRPAAESRTNPLFGYLSVLVLASVFLTCFAYRIIFLRRAKRIGRLLGTLSRYKLLQKSKTLGEWRLCWALSYIVTLLSLLFVLTGSLAFPAISVHVTSSYSFVANWVGRKGMYVVYVFGYYFLVSTRYVVFALIHCVTLSLGMAYHDLTAVVEERLRALDPQGSTLALDEDEEELQELFKRLGKIKEGSEASEKLLGPFLFTLILSAGWIVVSGSFAVIDGLVGTTAQRVFSVIHVLEHWVYLTVLFLGEVNKEMIMRRQKQVGRILTLKPGIDGKWKDLGEQLVRLQWKLTASNVFDVDKRLLSGIVSNSMNYIVVLFQFKLALEPIPFCSNPNQISKQANNGTGQQ